MDVSLEVGGIYQPEWDTRAHRIIGCDEIEVFYDCFWPELNAWTFSGNFKRKSFFYRTIPDVFKKKSKKINTLPLSKEEFSVFRPDIPMRIARIKNLNWGNLDFNSVQAFDKFLQNALPANRYAEKIELKEIFIQPYGPKGGVKKASKITADNGTDFRVSELIWKARIIQNAVYPDKNNGVGLYRLGFEKGTPSYYTGHYLDSAGFIKE